MAEAAMIEEEIKVPEGGIADFIMDDADADAIYGADEEVTSGGIGQFTEVAQEMAAAGREGDDVIAHLETGELIIPKAFLDQNPEMKETIFAFLESQGVEDPQRYVVGTDANSINPETGVPEFFGFIKKAFKKVVSGVKKVVKKVVKVVKKIAPVILPIVGTMMFGPIYGAAMGSGIATLINGGNVKDALKSALISGVTGGVSAGVSGMMSGVGFGQGIANAASFNNIKAGFGSIGNAFKGDFSGISAKNMGQGPASEGGTAFEQYNLAGGGPEVAQLSGTTNTSNLGMDPAISGTDTNLINAQTAADTSVTGPGTFKANIKDAFTPGGKDFGASMKDAFLPKGPTASEFLAKEGLTPISASKAQLAGAQLMAKEAAPSLIAKYAPIAGATALAAGAAGAFKTPDQEDPGLVQRDENGNVVTGTDLIEQDPSDYLIGDIGTRRLNPNTGQYEDVASSAINNSPYTIPTNYRFNNPYTNGTLVSGPFARPQMMAADGGEVYPRRNGGIMPDEGIPNQDSVRAMLMPGEFVMTTDAVKGLGNGNMNQGINNMYTVMRGLENRGRTTA
tara:strand:- start:9 stop:1703 length:1695 start_codon:yes stop_codon:yes gene_type:complete